MPTPAHVLEAFRRFPKTITHAHTGVTAYLSPTTGVYHWSTNDAVVPTDCMAEIAPKGYDLAKHEDAHHAMVVAFFASYRAAPRQRSAEELSEIRNNIGEDAIDVITGQRIFGKVG